jgi:hypothetical protein
MAALLAFARLAGMLWRAIAPLGAVGGFRQQRFIAHELVTILLQNRAGECLAADHEYSLAVFLQLVHQRNKIAVAADNGERVDVRMGEGHFQRIQRQVDVAPVFVSARRRQALHHLHGVLRHRPRRAFLAAPVGISELGHQVSSFFERIERERYIELAPQR